MKNTYEQFSFWSNIKHQILNFNFLIMHTFSRPPSPAVLNPKFVNPCFCISNRSAKGCWQLVQRIEFLVLRSRFLSFTKSIFFLSILFSTSVTALNLFSESIRISCREASRAKQSLSWERQFSSCFEAACNLWERPIFNYVFIISLLSSLRVLYRNNVANEEMKNVFCI